jgi:hypothetical protein
MSYSERTHPTATFAFLVAYATQTHHHLKQRGDLLFVVGHRRLRAYTYVIKKIVRYFNIITML